METFIQQVINGISLGGIYALIAIGYTMVYGIIELINFAHGDVYTMGSFFSIAVIGLLDASGQLSGWPLFGVITLTVVAAMLLCGVVGMLLERLAYRRLRNAPRLAPLITAIGASFILENVMQLWQGPSPIPFPSIVPNVTWTLGGIIVQSNELLVVGTAITMMVVLQTFIYNTRLGKAMRATAQDRDAAQLMGININMTIALTFFIGSALAGAGGFVSGVYYGSTWFYNGFEAGLKAFTAAVLGGIGNVAGAMLGGFVIGMVESLTAGFISQQWATVAVFLLLVLVLIFRPSGLLGEALPDKV
ncbi:MAG TPA: branched-chain amino acid ABC transporter permease [Candidatus Dormibacteraeota bacterium]|nr:branched-chain amino acid ABC transporter permease [Candidatus Dormibacteraeota bacterium]